MRLNWKYWLWILYSVGVFGYLAWPLMRSLLADTWRALRALRTPHLVDIL
jgi:hypothetical protein